MGNAMRTAASARGREVSIEQRRQSGPPSGAHRPRLAPPAIRRVSCFLHVLGLRVAPDAGSPAPCSRPLPAHRAPALRRLLCRARLPGSCRVPGGLRDRRVRPVLDPGRRGGWSPRSSGGSDAWWASSSCRSVRRWTTMAKSCRTARRFSTSSGRPTGVCWERGDARAMGECRHGLKLGCVYCHGSKPAVARAPGQKRPTRPSRLSEQMNDRMTALKRRLRQLRGE